MVTVGSFSIDIGHLSGCRGRGTGSVPSKLAIIASGEGASRQEVDVARIRLSKDRYHCTPAIEFRPASI